jgi:hypothetical protein
MYARFMLPARGLETLFLLSQDRHASGVVYFSESAGGADDVVEVEVQAFYRSEGAFLERTVCALRRSQGERGIGVLVSYTARLSTPLPPNYTYKFAFVDTRLILLFFFMAVLQAARTLAPDKTTNNDNTLTLKITVWLPRHRSEADVVFVPRLETDLPQFQHVIGDLHTHRFGQVSFKLSSTNGVPVDADPVRRSDCNLESIPVLIFWVHGAGFHDREGQGHRFQQLYSTTVGLGTRHPDSWKNFAHHQIRLRRSKPVYRVLQTGAKAGS